MNGRAAGRRRFRTLARAAFVPLAVALVVAQADSARGQIVILSQTDRGTSAEGRSNTPALSADGSTAAFASDALDLVPPRRDQHRSDVFVRSVGGAPTTERVVSAIDGEPNAASQASGFAPAISADGRTVAFASGASNLVDNDTNGVDDIFITDASGSVTSRVEGDFGEPDATSSFARLSGDGRWVVYTSQATNLVPDDNNEATDVFLYDRDSGATRRLSIASDGSEANGDSRTPAISADASTVAFVSAATNLVEQEVGGFEQIYVHDIASGETRLASQSSEGQPANGNCFLPDLTADGSIVAFKSEGFNLVSETSPFPDTNGLPDVFVHDSASGETVRISVDDFGNQSNGLSGGPAISDDGRYVAFISFSSNFDPLDGNGFSDVFVVDLDTRDIERVSVALDASGRPGGNVPDFPTTISANGVWIGFASAAENLVAGDINNQIDSFVSCNPFEAEQCASFPTPTATATPEVTPAAGACTGDCDGNGTVSINELIRMTNIALGVSLCGEGQVAACPAGDANGDCAITVEELVRAVGNNLSGCTRFGDLPLDDIIAMCCPL